MRNRVETVLEFDKIIDMLAQHTASDMGRERALALSPSYGIEAVERALKLTEEAESYLIRFGRSPVDCFPDMRDCVARMHATLYLNAGELLDIARILKASRLARTGIDRDGAEGLLVNLCRRLIVHPGLEEDIARCILSPDEISDQASPELARIRRSQRQINEKIRDKLNTYIRSSQYSKYLQEALITLRNGRYVIPVKQEYRQQFPGLIHDQSGSGSTLFVEPAAVVELGNELRKLQLEETVEIERILSALTAEAAPHSGALLESMDVLGELDMIFARAVFAREMGAVRPIMNSDGNIHIKHGRHPLIPRSKVVPVDIWLGDAFRILIITGPNTGGKTVTIKTVGLFTLMAQSGLFVPADAATKLSVFDSIFADIGDEQSIEQSLSTFSSHMTNVVEILKRADGASLVLLDELGAGTDPAEGASLAMSILDELDRRGSVSLVTTHYSEIKAFAMSHDRMENACMEFDVDRLCPTYRLFVGIPGRSNAFEISRRLGLDEKLIDDARAHLKSEDMQFETIIANAETRLHDAEREYGEADSLKKEAEALRNELAREREKLASEKEEIRRKARAKAKELVAEAREDAERIIEQLKKASSDKATARAIQTARDDLRKLGGEYTDTLEFATADVSDAPVSLRPGDTVRVTTLDKLATVLSSPDAKGDVQVQVGIIKMTVKLKDVRLVQEPTNQQTGGRIAFDPGRTVGLELDIRGMLVDEAIPVVDRYLDDASRAGLSEVNIIHGKGTGALRAGIQAFLKHRSGVKGFRMGSYGEGDAGVTVVSLK